MTVNFQSSVRYLCLIWIGKGVAFGATVLLLTWAPDPTQNIKNFLIFFTVAIIFGVGDYWFQQNIHHTLFDSDEDYRARLLAKLEDKPLWRLIEMKWISSNFADRYGDAKKAPRESEPR